jgi:Mu transposase, C-terminal./Integrase core domain.
MKEWVTTAEIAEATGKSKSTIRRIEGTWERRLATARGGHAVEYRSSSLPEDFQAALCAAIATKPAEPVVRGAGLESVPAHAREKAADRAIVLSLWKKSGLSVRDFSQAYTSGSVTTPEGLRDRIPEVSVSTLMRWKKAKTRGDMAALAPRSGGKRGRRALTKEEASVAASLYLDPRKPKVARVYRDFRKVFPASRASYDTVLRFVQNDLPQGLVVRMREGAKAYNDKVAAYIERDYTLIQPMENWFSDHHVLDLVVTDGVKIFRPWVTAWQDQRSRKITGWTISDNPCSVTIMSSLRMGVERFGSPWNATMDNGKDYLCKALNGSGIWVTKESDGLEEPEYIRIAGAFEALGVAVHHAQPYHGQSKPIERFFGTLCEEFSKRYETYVGSNTVTRPFEASLYYRRIGDMEKKDVLLTLAEVEADFAAWVEEWNATWKHSGQGMDGRTPDEVFAENALTPITVIPAALDIIFTKPKAAKVQRNGVTMDGIRYWADELAGLEGHMVIIRRPYDDAGKVLVYRAEDDTYLCEATNAALKDEGIAAENIERAKRVNKKKLAVVAAAQKYIAEGVNSLSFEEKVALEAAKPKGGKRKAPAKDEAERMVSGNPLPFPGLKAGPKKLPLKTGFEIYDRAQG